MNSGSLALESLAPEHAEPGYADWRLRHPSLTWSSDTCWMWTWVPLRMCSRVYPYSFTRTALQGRGKRVKLVSRSSQPCGRQSFRPLRRAGRGPAQEQEQPARPGPCRPQGRQSRLRLDLDHAHSRVFQPSQASGAQVS